MWLRMLKLLLVFLAVSVRGGWTRSTKFELPSTRQDPDQFEKGREKFSEYTTYAESSPCWKLALTELNSTCKALTEENQSRLALAFSNCHWERSGRETYPCPADTSFKECTCKERMGDSAFMVYTQFFTHTSSMCYYLQSQMWQDKTENTVNLLSETSDVVVSKLDEALDYHRVLDYKQDESLNNQQLIIDQDRKIAESLDKTSTKMSKTFQEMQDKAERHNLLIDDSLGKLLRGMDSVKWLLSFILGEMVQLETVWFFVVVFLAVTMAPQFGTSRLTLYAVLGVYGFVEAMLRRVYLWIRVPDSSNMATLHYLLYWSRWVGLAVMAVVYLRCWLVYFREDRKVTVLLEKIHHLLERNSMFASDSRTRPAASPTFSAQYQQCQQQQLSSFHIDEELDSGIDSSPSELHSFRDVLQGGNGFVVPFSEMGKRLQAEEGKYLTGTQMLDYLSGLYIAKNARRYSPDELSDHSDGSDVTYIPDNDSVALHTSYSTDISTVDTLNRSYDALGEPLNRSSLPLHQLREPYSQGNTKLPGDVPLFYHQSVGSVSGMSRHKHCPGAFAMEQELEKEVAVEKDDDKSPAMPTTPRVGRSSSTRRKPRQSTPRSPPTSQSRYNLRSRRSPNS